MASGRPRRQAVRADGVITRLSPAKKGSHRVAVHLDGSAAFDLAEEVVDGAGLGTGDLLSKDAQDRLLEADAPYKARDRALGLLVVRDRSRREMEVRLGTAGFSPEVVFATISWLDGLGYLDDKRFVAGYVAERLRRGWGRQRIRAELLGRGLERGLIDEALGAEEVAGTATEEGLEAVIRLARRRFGAQFAADPPAAARRLAGFLARRGYDWDAIEQVTRVLRREAGGDETTGAGEPVHGEDSGL